MRHRRNYREDLSFSSGLCNRAESGCEGFLSGLGRMGLCVFGTLLVGFKGNQMFYLKTHLVITQKPGGELKESQAQQVRKKSCVPSKECFWLLGGF